MYILEPSYHYDGSLTMMLDICLFIHAYVVVFSIITNKGSSDWQQRLFNVTCTFLSWVTFSLVDRNSVHTYNSSRKFDDLSSPSLPPR